MPTEPAQLFLGVAVLILLAVTLGMLSARLFMSASASAPRARVRRTDDDRIGTTRSR